MTDKQLAEDVRLCESYFAKRRQPTPSRPDYGDQGCGSKYLPRAVPGKKYEVHIRPGIYEINSSLRYSGIPDPIPMRMESDEILVLRDEKMRLVEECIESFYSQQKLVEDMEFVNKWGLLLYGPPGSGKTYLLRQISEQAVKDGRVVFITHNIYSLHESIQTFRCLEPDRDLICIMEDVDQLMSYGQQCLLEMLDGMASTRNVLFVATTNDLNKIPAKMKRPGRFGKRVEIPYPNLELRKSYLEAKLKDRADSGKIAMLAEQTEGLGFAHLREFCVMHFAYQIPITEAIQELKSNLQEDNSPKDCESC